MSSRKDDMHPDAQWDWSIYPHLPPKLPSHVDKYWDVHGT